MRILYAVLTKHEREVKRRAARRVQRRTPENMIHTKRMALALTWVAAFWQANSATLTRVYAVKEVDADLGITTDASPWGVGAILLHVTTGKVMSAIEATLTPEDADELGVIIGDPAGQGVLELLGIFLALQCWIHHFQRRRRVPQLRADSLAALGAARKYASPVPAMNHLGGELGLLLEVHDVPEPVSAHLPGPLNVAADYTSRINAPKVPPIPDCLRGVKVKSLLRGPKGRNYLLPTATERPDLWGADTDSDTDE